MKQYKKILSYFLLFTFLLSGVHGATTHCHDSDHHHIEHDETNHAHNHEGECDNPLQFVAHEMYHYVAHLLEHQANDHLCCFEVIPIENRNDVKTSDFNSDIVGHQLNKIILPVSNLKANYFTSLGSWSNIYLTYPSLRGPPTIE